MVNLKLLLDATAGAWQANLRSLFERMHFVLGEQVSSFEGEFAAAMGARYAVGVGTGTAAIEIALRDAGIGHRQQQALTSALTSPFTALAVLAAGASPRFADVNPESLQMDPDDAGNRITRSTAALIPVHLYGQTCEIERLRPLARGIGAALIQDACQAHGARRNGRPLTEFSPYVAYSFYPTKNLGCLGDGGAIATSSASAANRLRLLRDGGRKGDQVCRLPSVNSRLDEMQACYLRAFLGKLEEWNADRARTVALYDGVLADCEAVRPVRRESVSVHHLYVIRAKRRERLRDYLKSRGIMTAVHYPVPLHLHPAFLECGLRRGDLPHSERACREILSLPLWPLMPESTALHVAGEIRSFYRTFSGLAGRSQA